MTYSPLRPGTGDIRRVLTLLETSLEIQSRDDDDDYREGDVETGLEAQEREGGIVSSSLQTLNSLGRCCHMTNVLLSPFITS